MNHYIPRPGDFRAGGLGSVGGGVHDAVTKRVVDDHFPCVIGLAAKDGDGQGGHLAVGSGRGPLHQVEGGVAGDDHLVRAISEVDAGRDEGREHGAKLGIAGDRLAGFGKDRGSGRIGRHDPVDIARRKRVGHGGDGGQDRGVGHCALRQGEGWGKGQKYGRKGSCHIRFLSVDRDGSSGLLCQKLAVGCSVRVFRLFEVMDRLRARTQPVTARDLAAEMGVSIRTMYRDIADLQGMGAPIRGEGGIGYVMERGYFLPSLTFDEEELAALSLGTKLVAARTSDSLAGAAKRAAGKIASAIGEASREGFLESPLAAGTSAATPTPATGALQDRLRAAIRERRKLEISYLSLSNRASTRVARPLGLTVFDAAWLLTIWCETAEDFRHLRLDRIEAIADTGQTFRHERGKRFADALHREDGSA